MTDPATLPGVPDGMVRLVGPGRQDAFLPAPTPQAHAANVMFLPGGVLGCVWFGGTQEGVPDVSVYYSRLEPGSTTWSRPVQLSDDRTRSEQNPVLFVTPDDTVWLMYTAQLAGHQDTAEIRCRVSNDGGASFGPVRVLIPADERGGVFVRQPPLVTADGRWLLGVFNCARVPGERWAGQADTSSVYASPDGGASWAETPVPASLGQVHMNPLPLPDGSLLALYRSRWADAVHASWSDDGGRTFSAPRPVELPNNNSSIQAAALADGRIALVYNHASAADASERRVSLYDEIDDDGSVHDDSVPNKSGPNESGPNESGPNESGPNKSGPNKSGPADATAPGFGDSTTESIQRSRRAFWGAPRAPLTLAISSDGGRTWPLRRDLEVGSGYCMTNNSRAGLNRELSYPSIRQGPEGDLHIAFTYFRQAIKYVRVSLDWVEQGGPAR